jgi:hypothetical protein
MKATSHNLEMATITIKYKSLSRSRFNSVRYDFISQNLIALAAYVANQQTNIGLNTKEEDDNAE